MLFSSDTLSSADGGYYTTAALPPWRVPPEELESLPFFLVVPPVPLGPFTPVRSNSRPSPCLMSGSGCGPCGRLMRLLVGPPPPSLPPRSLVLPSFATLLFGLYLAKCFHPRQPVLQKVGGHSPVFFWAGLNSFWPTIFTHRYA